MQIKINYFLSCLLYFYDNFQYFNANAIRNNHVESILKSPAHIFSKVFSESFPHPLKKERKRSNYPLLFVTNYTIDFPLHCNVYRSY